MATAAPLHPISFEQYEEFESPEGFRDELIHGRIVVSPEPKALHYDVADNLYRLLTAASGKKYRVAQRMNLRFSDANSMPSPDVFVVRLAEWKRARAENVYPEGAKVLLAVQVISPSNRPGPLAAKVGIYLTHGLQVWVADPKSQEVKLHRQGERTRTASVKSKSVLHWNGKSVPLAKIFQLP